MLHTLNHQLFGCAVHFFRNKFQAAKNGVLQVYFNVCVIRIHNCTSLHYDTPYEVKCNHLFFAAALDTLFSVKWCKVVEAVAEALLVNRTRFTSSLKNELMKDFNRLAEETRIPKSRLIDEAIEDLLKKYEKRMAE
ncbi:ribbon-helix-helix domain-containing protein [Pseudoflavonifractor phocaeensis]|nr:ribbon-helix-helix domain-containing protein [Pseudoflavonifractor phocaeensis]